MRKKPGRSGLGSEAVESAKVCGSAPQACTVLGDDESGEARWPDLPTACARIGVRDSVPLQPLWILMGKAGLRFDSCVQARGYQTSAVMSDE
jgi:hypothetical protein